MKPLIVLLILALPGCQWSARIEADTVGCAGFVARKISIETQGKTLFRTKSEVAVDAETKLE